MKTAPTPPVPNKRQRRTNPRLPVYAWTQTRKICVFISENARVIQRTIKTAEEHGTTIQSDACARIERAGTRAQQAENSGTGTFTGRLPGCFPLDASLGSRRPNRFLRSDVRTRAIGRGRFERLPNNETTTRHRRQLGVYYRTFVFSLSFY